MPKVNLSGMTIEALMELRERVDEMLRKHRAVVEKQLERMDRASAVVSCARGGRGALKGKKVPPKYRGPSGETWAAVAQHTADQNGNGNHSAIIF